MPSELAELLRRAVEAELPLLRSIDEAKAGEKSAGKWSRKEELGHLIDSASNNHLRFVRASLEPEFHGAPYDQDRSVALHGYQDTAWRELVDFWRAYNVLLAELVQRIPAEKLDTTCRVGESAPITLGFLVEDYVLHMRHHLDHMAGRDKITQYAGAALGV